MFYSVQIYIIVLFSSQRKGLILHKCVLLCPLSFYPAGSMYEVTINKLRFDNANHEKLTKHEVDKSK